MNHGRFSTAGLATGRQPVLGRQEMVVSPDAWASAVGARVLHDGGNAVDAAIATSAALCVAMPSQTSLGGDAFWLVSEAGAAATIGINASGPAGDAVDAEAARTQGLQEMPARSGLAVTVPGLVAGWVTAHQRFGRIGIGELLTAAIRAARLGRPVGPLLATELRDSAGLLASRTASARIFLPRGRPPEVGEPLVQTELAETLIAIGDDPSCFYRGDIADALCAAVTAEGGCLATTDLADYRPSFDEPIAHTAGNWSIEEFGPNSQGWCAHIGLAISQEARALGVEDDLHRDVEAAKFLTCIRDSVLAEPQRMPVDARSVLASVSGYASHIGSRQALSLHEIESVIGAQPASQRAGTGDTVHFAIVDRWGGAVSCIQSLFDDFGTGIVIPGTGVLLHNRGRGFSLTAGHPNELTPGCRPAHTLSPAIARVEGQLAAVFGTMGGYAQAQLHMQLIRSLALQARDPVTAIDAPRWYVQRDAGGFSVVVEDGLDDAGLRSCGHEIVRKPRYWSGFGHAQVLLADDAGVLMGASDPRSAGAAVGW